MKLSLFQLPFHKCGVIKEINVEETIKERLHSLGLMRGTKIISIRSTPLGCPRIYRFFNTYVAIRGNIAKQIEIEFLDEPQ